MIVLIQRFRDSYNGGKYLDTDIAKSILNFSQVKRYDYEKPNPYVQAQKGELKNFCGLFGRAYSYFETFDPEDDDFFPLVKDLNGRVVGFSIFKNFYFFPPVLFI